MIILKAEYERLIKDRDDYRSIAERVCKTNGELVEFSETLINRLKEYEKNPLARPEKYLDITMAIVDDMTMAQRRELLKYLEESIEKNKKPITKEEWEENSSHDLH